MAAEVELERLVATLTADASTYLNMLKDAQQGAVEATKRIEESSKKIEGFGHHVEGFAGRAEEALKGIGLAIGLEKAFQKFEEAERLLIRLDAVIEANGEVVKTTVAGYKNLATELLRTGAVSKTTTLTLAKQAEGFGLTGEAANKAVKEALALAAFKDEAPEMMMRMAAAMATGDVETAQMFKRMIPELRRAKDETQFLSIYNKLVAAGMKVMGEEAGKLDGQMNRVSASLGALTKEIGGLVASGIEPFVKYIGIAVDWFNSIDATTRKYIVTGLVLLALVTPLTYVIGFLAGKVMALVGFFTSLITIQGALGTGLGLSERAMTLLKVAAIGLAIAGIALLIDKITGASAALADFNKAIAESGKLTDKLVGVKGEGFSKALARATDLGDPVESVKALNDLLGQTQNELLATERNLNSSKKKVEALEGGTIKELTIGGFGPGMGKKADFEAAQKQLEQDKKLYEQLEEQVKRVREAMKGKTGDIMVDPAVKAAEAAIAAASATAEESKKVADESEGMRKALVDSMNAMDMGADAAKIYDLRMRGLADSEVTWLEGLLRQKDAMEAHKKAMDEGKALTEQFLDPMEKFNEEVSKLAYLLGEGAITTETYNLALADAQQKLDTVGASASTAREEVQKLDAVLSGGAEAQARIAAYTETINLGREGRVSTQSGTGVGSQAALPILTAIASILEDIRRRQTYTTVEESEITIVGGPI
jgi:hypothetical protein